MKLYNLVHKRNNGDAALRLLCSTPSEMASGKVDVDTANLRYRSASNVLILNYEYNPSVSADT